VAEKLFDYQGNFRKANQLHWSPYEIVGMAYSSSAIKPQPSP
jgi:hypothetical protein